MIAWHGGFRLSVDLRAAARPTFPLACKIPRRVVYCWPTEVSRLAKLYTRKEAEDRRIRFAALAGIFDGLGTLAGIVVIFACVILVTALFTWIVSDARNSFATISDTLSRAVIIPGE